MSQGTPAPTTEETLSTDESHNESITQATKAAIDDTSRVFLGQWHTLVSTTNWEKGRIIKEWRDERKRAGMEISEYSDEAWAQLVGDVTSQHVGRLRRAYERFGKDYQQYPGLYWSHFHVALDWDDAELWLEGAVQNKWSVAKMRRQHDNAHGKADALESETSSVASAPGEHDAHVDSELTEVQDFDSDSHERDDRGEPTEVVHAESDESGGEMPSAGKVAPAKTRPFASLPELPDDLADAFEAFKLAILSHKLTQWQDVSRDDVINSLEALKKLALAPSE